MLAALPAWAVGDQDLAREAAKAAGVTQKQARAVIDALKESIFEHLKVGEEVRFKGLGKFYVKHRDARKARNPKTGKEIDVPARNYLRFKAYDSANKRLN
ncbi:MAG: HU family DNA-binding protein [Gammaproteobacteria bacterium]|nr:MAG: HU family DNA-binding protein [Gammaproteobacteria bacterium]